MKQNPLITLALVLTFASHSIAAENSITSSEYFKNNSQDSQSGTQDNDGLVTVYENGLKIVIDKKHGTKTIYAAGGTATMSLNQGGSNASGPLNGPLCRQRNGLE